MSSFAARARVFDPAPEFSLVRGGLVYELWCRFGMANARLDLWFRRVAIVVLVAWVPLLVIAYGEGKALGGVALPFIDDIELHVRLLVALPLLLIAEVVAHRRMLAVAAQFLERGLVPDAARARFDAAIASASRLRDSYAAEVVIVLLVYGVGVLYLWRTQVALDVSSWYGVFIDGALRPSRAGWWLGLVSLPLFQFFLLRWYYRLFIWVRFMWQISRIELHLMPTHADRAGGLGFLGLVSLAFGPLVMAQSALMAGVVANRIFYAGAQLLDYKFEMVGFAALMVVLVLGPLVVYAPRLEAAARTGRREYGMLAQHYAIEFDRKWLRGGAPPEEALLGSADIQSLADMGGSLERVSSMRWVPFPSRAVLEVVFMTFLPFSPLALTMLSPSELLERVLNLLF